MEEKKYCKKIRFSNEFNSFGQTISVKCVLGIIIQENDNFMEIQSRHGKMLINKNFIISLSDTNVPFECDSELYGGDSDAN